VAWLPFWSFRQNKSGIALLITMPPQFFYSSLHNMAGIREILLENKSSKDFFSREEIGILTCSVKNSISSPI
jgi:hypothetical protein